MRRLPALLLICAWTGAVQAGECPAPASGPEEWFGQRAWVALQEAGYRFGPVEYVVRDVYGAADDRSDAWYAQAMNLLHVDTRPSALAPHLLFELGQPVDAELVHQTERRLRRLSYLLDARLVPVSCADGVVTIRVETHDAWSLKFGLNFKSVGGQTSTGLFLNDLNFLGTGRSVYIRDSSDPARDSLELGFHDPAFLGSKWNFSAQHATQSDGISNFGLLQLPFSTHTAPWAFRIMASDVRETLSFYDQGEVAWTTRFITEQQELGAWRLLDWDGQRGWRAGLSWIESRDSYTPLTAVDPSLRPPPALSDRERRGLVFSVVRFHDHWATFRDLQSIDRTEDINLGLDATLGIGHFPAEFTSTKQAWSASLDAQWAARIGPEVLAISRLQAALRRESGGDTRDGRVDFEGALYWMHAPGRTRVLHLALHDRQQPDPEHHIYLGGEDGLLGYPTNFVAADRAWTLHYAERLVTRHVWFQTLRVGWTVFAEAGQAKRTDDRGWSPTLVDVGGGLRLGNLRGTDRQPIYLSVAVPLRREPGSEAYQMVLGVVLDF
jgi:hypothetical protein